MTAATRAAIAALLDEHMAGHPERERTEAALLQLLGVRGGRVAGRAVRGVAGVLRGALRRRARSRSCSRTSTGPTRARSTSSTTSSSGPATCRSSSSRSPGPSCSTIDRPGERPAAASPSLSLEPLPRDGVRALLRRARAAPPGIDGRRRSSRAPRACRCTPSRPSGCWCRTAGFDRSMACWSRRAISVSSPTSPSPRRSRRSSRLASTACRRAIAPCSSTPRSSARASPPAGLAAVSGRTEAALAPRLDDLVRRELLRPIADPRSPERGQYIFVQALIREIAYGTLAKRDRITRHLAVARWLEGLGGSRARRRPSRATSSPPTGSSPTAPRRTSWPRRAVVALRAAGDRAASLSVPAQAMSFYEQAADLATDPATQAELLELAGDNAGVHAEFDAADALARPRHRDPSTPRRAARPSCARRPFAHAASCSSRRLEQARSVLDDAMIEFADLEGSAPYSRPEGPACAPAVPDRGPGAVGAVGAGAGRRGISRATSLPCSGMRS